MWRDNQFYENDKYKFNIELDFQRLIEEFGNTYVIFCYALSGSWKF